MPITTKELAERLGLSPSTVSRVLSDAPGHRVSTQTRRRVLEAAAELEHRPNAVARSLRRGRTGVVGLYTRHNYDARNEFLGAVLGGLQRACGRRQLDLLLFNGLDGRDPAAIAARLGDGRIDGLLLHAGLDDPVLAHLGDLPRVAVADPLPGVPTIGCDDTGGLTLLIDHLWLKGYRRYRFLAPGIALGSVARRLAAFEAELAGRGLARAERRVLRVPFESPQPVLAELTAQPGPLAVCCWNDRTAYELLKACAATGLEVPGRLAVTGFDGFLDTKVPARRLVTVACPWDLVAEAALDTLSELLAGQAVTGERLLGVRLVEGDTA
jgi:DNA-binding LacI/PurR family transcriptional regulator